MALYGDILRKDRETEEYVHLREFPPPVILDQARERAALSGKSYTGFSEVNCCTPFFVVSRGTEGTDR